MNQNTAASLLIPRLLSLTVGNDMVLLGPVVQTLVNETIASGKPSEKVRIIHVVHWNMEMFVAPDQLRVVIKVPI